MTTHRLLVAHQSIEEVLHEPGCPLCRFLKDFQAIHLQGDLVLKTSIACAIFTPGAWPQCKTRRPQPKSS